MKKDRLKPEDIAEATEYKAEKLNEGIPEGEEERSYDSLDESEVEELLNIFGYRDETIDNLFNPKERQLLNRLDNLDFAKTEEEVAYLPSGKKWRIYYWILKKDEMYEALEEKREGEDEEGGEDVYKELDDEAWERSSGGSVGIV